jgi:hypothetical protein
MPIGPLRYFAYLAIELTLSPRNPFRMPVKPFGYDVPLRASISTEDTQLCVGGTHSELAPAFARRR